MALTYTSLGGRALHLRSIGLSAGDKAGSERCVSTPMEQTAEVLEAGTGGWSGGPEVTHTEQEVGSLQGRGRSRSDQATS